MICPKCSSWNDDRSLFCRGCGTSLRAVRSVSVPPPAPRSAPAAPAVPADPRKRPLTERSDKGVKALLALGVLVTAVLLVLAGIRLVNAMAEDYKTHGLSSGEAAVMAFLEASAEADGEAAVDLLPERVVKSLCREEDVSREGLRRSLSRALAGEGEAIRDRYGKWSYSCRLVETAELPQEEMERLQKDYHRDYDVAVRDALSATVELTVRLAEGGARVWYENLTAVKTGGRWYIDIYTLK